MSEIGFLRRFVPVASLLFIGAAVACSGSSPDPEGTGGGPATGGAAAGGGGPSGGAATGGAAVGGASSTGGTGVGGASSTGGAGLGGTPEGADWATTASRVAFDCGNSICHGGTEMLCLAKDGDRTGGEGSFCKSGTTLYETLLGTRVEQCGDIPLVDPGKPETSAILRLITRQCGDFVMPANCPSDEQGYPTCWPEYAVLELSTWIARGAPLE